MRLLALLAVIALAPLPGCLGGGRMTLPDDLISPPCDDDDSATGDDDDTTEPGYDCNALPQGPLDYGIVFGPRATEDMAFDDQGHVIGADNGNLLKSTYDGEFTIFAPNAGGFIAGLRALPSGDVVYADVSSGTMFLVDQTGSKTPIVSGLLYANGIEVDLEGYVYVAEQEGGRVRRIDPYTGEFDMVVENLDAPNGVTFSPDYSTLYIGSFGWGTIHALPFDEQGNPGQAELLVQGLGNGMLDGMGVDACGNIYICEYLAARVWRISPDGTVQGPLIDFSADTDWIPNMQWGSGIGGWQTDHLYVLDITAAKMYEVPVGVPGKPRAYP